MARALLAAIAMVGTLVLAGAPAATAQGGAGLYVPFPQPARTDRARAYFGDLVPTSVSGAAFRRGVVLPAGRSLRTPAIAVATNRAGSGADPDGGAGWLAVAAIAAIAGAVLAAAALRHRPPVSH